MSYFGTRESNVLPPGVDHYVTYREKFPPPDGVVVPVKPPLDLLPIEMHIYEERPDSNLNYWFLVLCAAFIISTSFLVLFDLYAYPHTQIAMLNPLTFFVDFVCRSFVSEWGALYIFWFVTWIFLICMARQRRTFFAYLSYNLLRLCLDPVENAGDRQMYGVLNHRPDNEPLAYEAASRPFHRLAVRFHDLGYRACRKATVYGYFQRKLGVRLKSLPYTPNCHRQIESAVHQHIDELLEDSPDLVIDEQILLDTIISMVQFRKLRELEMIRGGITGSLPPASGRW